MGGAAILPVQPTLVTVTVPTISSPLAAASDMFVAGAQDMGAAAAVIEALPELLVCLLSISIDQFRSELLLPCTRTSSRMC